jgi:predicted nucleotidyltransferase
MPRYNYKNKGICKMDKEQVIELTKRYAEIIKEYFNISKIVLFGSYIKGT